MITILDVQFIFYLCKNIFFYQKIGIGSVITPLVGLIEAVAIGKAFGRFILIFIDRLINPFGWSPTKFWLLAELKLWSIVWTWYDVQSQMINHLKCKRYPVELFRSVQHVWAEDKHRTVSMLCFKIKNVLFLFQPLSPAYWFVFCMKLGTCVTSGYHLNVEKQMVNAGFLLNREEEWL